MSVLCTLGYHRPSPFPRWNHGYYFSTCRRCGQDLVRTAFESWHVPPRGYRVVWSATPPPNNVQTADLAPAEQAVPETTDSIAEAPPQEAVQPEAPSPPAESEIAVAPPADAGRQDHGDLPISEVLELLREEELRADAEMAAEAEAIALEEPSEAPAETEPSSEVDVAPDEETPLDDLTVDFMADPDDEPASDDFWGEHGEAVAEPDEPAEASEAEEEEPAAAMEAPLVADEEISDESAAPATEAENDEEPDIGEATEAAVPEPRDKTAWPSAAPSPMQIRIVGMDEPEREGQRRALRIAAGVALAAAILLLATRGNGSEAAQTADTITMAQHRP